jgi:serine/threonine protein kinase
MRAYVMRQTGGRNGLVSPEWRAGAAVTALVCSVPAGSATIESLPEQTPTTTSDFELRAQVSHALAAQYELGEEIGRGGMGIVYRARDRRLKRMVAVKLLPPELAYRSDIRSRFMREAETAAQLSHPNIVPIFTVSEDEKVVYFIMAYVEGDNLARILHLRGRMDPEEVRRILQDVASALAYAHARGVVHRDIKPDNILIDAESGRVMVTDFGIARAVTETAGARLTATGMALGTPAYMSPEQAAGDREIDGRTDIYALGVLGYQMLCGELPFQASSTPAMLVKHLSETPRPISDMCGDLPEDLARAVMLCLEKNPDDRFASASSLLLALQGGDIPPRSADWAVPLGTTATRRGAGTSPVPGIRPPGSYLPAPIPAPSRAPVPAPSNEELARWNVPVVRRFRRKLAPYLAFSAVAIPGAMFTGFDALLPATVFWGVYIAIQYSKLWSAGYDWRDVFRQPRDRLLVDVAADTLDDARAIFDAEKRDQLRERARARRRMLGDGGADTRGVSTGSVGTRGTARSPAATRATRGELPQVTRARAERDEIHRLLDALPDDDREMLREVAPSADALFDRVEALAQSVTALEQQDPARELSAVDREIGELEAQANPLETAASEQRVRRLAALRRGRRGLLDRRARRDDSRNKLESCRIALENMRLDLLRLHSGTQSYQNVTLVAEQAMQLARELDNYVQAVDESARIGAGAR